MKYHNNLGEHIEFAEVTAENCSFYEHTDAEVYQLFWFTSDHNVLFIDGEEFIYNKNDIIFLTYFNKVEFKQINQMNLLRFNRSFYCIKDHDSEVGCNGLLFFGSAEPAHIMPNKTELEVLALAWKMAVLEFEMRDNLQLEMLRMMLKRILILCTRIFKTQSNHNNLSVSEHDLVRKFNYLVETHFKEMHKVSKYADMLHKSPKTISNLFKKLGVKSPLEFIQDRIMLEAKRKLWHTQRDISEIAYDLGFSDIQAFSRFYKKNKGVSPTECRAQNQ